MEAFKVISREAGCVKTFTLERESDFEEYKTFILCTMMGEGDIKWQKEDKINYRTPILPTKPPVAMSHLWWSECIFLLFSFRFDKQTIAKYLE